MRRFRRWFALAVAQVALASIGTIGPAADETRPFSYSAPFFSVVDPHDAVHPNDERLILALFDPLTAYDPTTGEVVPAAARSWQVSPDGKTWTFQLRAGAKWSDGSPVKASDFVAAWRRMLDPYAPSSWSWAFRSMEGAATIADGQLAVSVLFETTRRLKDDVSDKGVEGKEVQTVLEETGVRPYLEDESDPDVKRFLRWGSDVFPKDKVENVLRALKSVRDKYKRQARDAFDAFGTTMGVIPKDDQTLEIHLTGRAPWLPALLARAPFVPLHPKTLQGGQDAFDPAALPTNGPYVRTGRVVRQGRDTPNPLTVVELVRSKTYDGPRRGQSEEVKCTTGEKPAEHLRRLSLGQTDWAADLAEGWTSAPKELKTQAEKANGFQAVPSGRVILLRFRCDRPPFDRREVRRAFAMAIDRAGIAKLFWPTALPATRVIPPVLVRPTGSPPCAPAGTAAQAIAALKSAGVDTTKFPWVDLHYLESPYMDEVADRVLASWKKAFGLDLGLRIDTAEQMDGLRRAGAFQVALGEIEGLVPDPSAYVGLFLPKHPQSGLGWHDDQYERLVEAALDVDAFVADAEARSKGLPEEATLRTMAQTASHGNEAERESLRLALLESAERRLLDEAVVVPLVIPQRAYLVGGAKGLGSDAAWKQPGYVGSIPNATH